MAEFRVRTEQGNPLVGTRLVPLNHLALTTSLQDFAEVRTGVMLRVARLSAVNVTGSAATVTLHAVPASGTAGDTNAELKAQAIAANTAVDLSDIIGGLYEAGTKLRALASANDTIVLHGWGEEIL
jgi:hypothetical protein